jgi:15-cis-phytoene synthase
MNPAHSADPQASAYAPRDRTQVPAPSSFDPGMRLLPHDLRADARQLYRLLSTIDDLVDDRDPQAADRVDAIERWASGQEADTPETHILVDLSQRHPIPSGAVLEFCQGMRHDLAGATIGTESELERYCQYVGGAVGVILTRMFATGDPGCENKMAILGRAFQRTNILRDIDEDHAHGRLYIAGSTIERFGFPTPGRRQELLRDQIARADKLYEEGLGAIPLLARGGRGMAVSTALYREILRQIERDGYGRDSGRAAVPNWRRRLLISKHRLKPTYR